MKANDTGRICFAVVNDRHNFYRTFLPASELAKRGFRVSLIKNPDFQGLRSFDTIVLEAPFSLRHDQLIRRLKGKARLVLDLDDNYHEIAPSNPRYAYLRSLRDVITRIIKSVDEVIVATEPLREFYRPLNDHISVLPNMIPAELFIDESGRAPRSGPLRIGWHGGFSHDADLQILKAVLPSIHEEYPDIRFIFFGNAPRLEIPNAEYVRPMPFEFFPGKLASLGLDIGLAPLTDSPFNRCKTNLKWLEYSALRVPIVASDIPPYADSIQSGVDGLLAATPDDWLRELRRLIRDPELRQSIGRRAHDTALLRFGCGVIGERYAELASGWTARRSTIAPSRDEPDRRSLESRAAAAPLERDSSPSGVDVFFAALVCAMLAMMPPLILLPALRPVSVPTTAWILGLVVISQGLSCGTTVAAMRRCLAMHRSDSGSRQPAAGDGAGRDLAGFFAYHRIRANLARSSRETIFVSSVVTIVGSIPMAILRQDSHPWIPLALFWTIATETGILSLAYASSFSWMSRRMGPPLVLPLDAFVRRGEMAAGRC